MSVHFCCSDTFSLFPHFSHPLVICYIANVDLSHSLCLSLSCPFLYILSKISHPVRVPHPTQLFHTLQLPSALYFSRQRGLHIKMAAKHCTNTNAAQGWWRLCRFTTCLFPSPAASLILSITLLLALAPNLPSTSCDCCLSSSNTI